MASMSAPDLSAAATDEVDHPRPKGIEAFFDAAHRRLGRWYMQTLVVATVLLVGLVIVPIEDLTQLPLWSDRGFAAWRDVFPFMITATISGAIVLPMVVRLRHPSLFALQRGESPPALDVWHEAVTKVPMTALIGMLLWSMPVNFGAMAWVARHENMDAQTYAAAVVLQWLLSVGSGASCFLLYELAWLPFARQVAADLPPTFVPAQGLSVNRRLMLVTTTVTLSIGCEAAGLSMGFDDRNVRIWVIVLGTVGLVCTFIGLFLALISSSLTRRVNALIASLRKLGRDAEHSWILPSTGDEFDSVGRLLNRTISMLDERGRGLQESRARLVAVADDTRRRTERDLHDGAQQHLALVSLRLGLLARRASERPDLAPSISRMRVDLAEALDELRRLAHGIYPVALELDGLPGALEAASRQSAVRVEFDAPDDLPRWRREVEAALYFCCWELIRSVSSVPDATVQVTLGRKGKFTLTAPCEADEATVMFLQDRIGAVGGDVSVAISEDQLVAHGRVRRR